MAVEYLSLADYRLAYQRQDGNKNFCGILFLSGFSSDMEGTKATFLADRAAMHDAPFVRFDYRGCGKSTGKFSDATIGAWLEDSLAILDTVTKGPQIIVGSSMGGWLSLLLAKARPERFRAFVGIAAAPDFTEDLIWDKLIEAQREALLRDGEIYDNDAPPEHRIPLTWKLIEEARKHLILRAPIQLKFPVRLLQGLEDREVPWQYAIRVAETISADDLQLTFIKGGSHRLNRPQDLETMWRTISEFMT